MIKCDIVIIPYRDMYFWQRYGSAVRDLQILEILNEMNVFENIHFINRPVSIYERLYNKKSRAKKFSGIKVIDKTSLDFFGPLQGRSWTRTCYDKQLSNIISLYKENEKKLIVLDFSPFMVFDVPMTKNIVFWHDMIDNFTKHNRFSRREKMMVENKYQHVSCNYKIVTGVTEEALAAIPNKNPLLSRYVFSNGVFNTHFTPKSNLPEGNVGHYDLGFIGFITNKFDVEFVTELARSYSIVVYGDSLDDSIVESLRRGGVTVMGRFKYQDLPSIMKTFKIGLLPYLLERSHDGSPLKMYEYLKYNKPCLTTISYEFEGVFVVNVHKVSNLDIEIKRLMNFSDHEVVSKSLPTEAYLKNKLKPIVEIVLNISD